MTIVVYQCDTCKRTIELQQNKKGLEIVQKCIITHGCRGNLFQQKVLQDYIRGRIPGDVVGLENWQPRKVLHNHTQTIQNDTWTITHNLGVFPVISVFVDRPTVENPNNQEEITPDSINYIDANVLELKFNNQWSGICQLFTLTSSVELFEPNIQEAEDEVAPAQLTNSGELSIATRISTYAGATPINIDLTYTNDVGSPIVKTYSVDDQPSLLSSWLDYNKIIFKGSVYTVRSFNTIVPEMADGTIVDGATVDFTNVNSSNDVIILLANAPFEIFDKITDEYVDVMNATQPTTFFYDNGEIFGNDNIIKTIYPHIREV